MKPWLISIFILILSPSPSVFAEIQVSTGLNVYHFDYKEDLPFREDLQAQLKSTESATILAPFLKARLPLPNLGRSFLEAYFEGASAASHFDGTTLKGAPVTDTNSHLFFRGELDFYWELVPYWYAYVGLGYNYWNRFLVGGTGYREIYTWATLPIGFRYEIPLSDELLWSFDFSYRTMFAGQIVIIFSETVIGGEDNTLELGNRPGYKIQSPFEMTLDSRWQIFFNPWYEVSEIGSSPYEFNGTPGINGLIQEPSSKTIQIGIAGGATYFF